MMKPYMGHIAMFLANVIWGLNAPFAKIAQSTSQISSSTLITFQVVGATLLFWLLSIFSPKEKISFNDGVKLFLASLLGITLNQACFIFGVHLTSPIDASVVCTSLPIVTLIVSALYVKEKITAKKAVGILVGAVGAVLLIFGTRSGNSTGSSSIWGDLLILLGQIGFATYLVVFSGIRKYSLITLMKWMFLFSSICFIPFSIKDIIFINYATIPLNIVLATLYVIICATFLAYIFISIGQKTIRPTVISMYNYVQPVVATIAAIFLGMDSFSLVKFIAILLVFAGVYFVTKNNAEKA